MKTVYQTFDGKTFDDRSEAITYENLMRSGTVARLKKVDWEGFIGQLSAEYVGLIGRLLIDAYDRDSNVRSFWINKGE